MTTPTTRIIPSKLYRIHIVESVEWFKYEEGGRKRLDEQSDLPLEMQINDWVDRTKSLIVGMGPVTFVTREPDPKTELISDTVCERRMIAITYVTAVEQGAQVYGEGTQEVELGQAGRKAKPEDKATSPGVSDGFTRRRQSLRVPDIAGEPVTGGKEGAESES